AHAITRDPPMALPPSASVPSAVVGAPVRPVQVGRRTWAGVFFPLATFLAMVLLALYAAPALLYRWRAAEAQGDAEAAYQRRRGELRAEAEAADQRLDLLDKRVNLVSLGFREVVRKVAPKVVNVANYREPRQAEAALLGKRVLVRD